MYVQAVVLFNEERMALLAQFANETGDPKLPAEMRAQARNRWNENFRLAVDQAATMGALGQLMAHTEQYGAPNKKAAEYLEKKIDRMQASLARAEQRARVAAQSEHRNGNWRNNTSVAEIT